MAAGRLAAFTSPTAPARAVKLEGAGRGARNNDCTFLFALPSKLKIDDDCSSLLTAVLHMSLTRLLGLTVSIASDSPDGDSNRHARPAALLLLD